MKTSDFDYHLPVELIAQTPVEPRDASRLLVIHRDVGHIEHRTFRDIAEYLQPGDLLVLNQTRVIPARLFGRKADTGGKVELLLLKRHEECTWEALVRGKGLRAGIRIEIQAGGQKGQGVKAIASEKKTGRLSAGAPSNRRMSGYFLWACPDYLPGHWLTTAGSIPLLP